MRRLAILALLACLGCNGPVGVFPGGALSGEGRPAPDDWSFAGDHGTMQLETRPEDPYSVNLAYTVLEGQLFVNAGDTETRWVENLAGNPQVRMRLDGVVYALRAERVTDPDTIAAFARAWTAQSPFRRDPTGLERVFLYRLVAR